VLVPVVIRTRGAHQSSLGWETNLELIDSVKNLLWSILL